MDKKKIGIMGGTFDPPHLGHLISAENVKTSLKLDHIIFVPTGNIYYKDARNTSPAEIRMEMVSLMLQDKTGFSVSDTEVKTEGYSYTCDTLEKLKEMYPDSELYFIVGADSLDYMERWKNPERIFALSRVVAVGREGFSDEKNRKKAEELMKQFGGEIILLRMKHIDVSSTEIRKAVREGSLVSGMVSDSVMEYILKNNLYKNGDAK